MPRQNKLSMELADQIRDLADEKKELLKTAKYHKEMHRRYMLQARGLSHSKIAEKFGIAKATVQAVVEYRIY